MQESEGVLCMRVSFRIALAGQVIGVSALYEQTRTFCKNYLTDAPASFEVAVTPADIAFEREKSDREAAVEGHAPGNFSDEYLETLALYRKIVERLLEWDTLLFHGSCISVDSKAYLFTAKSGTGKSTHTQLWKKRFGERAVFINDDKPLLKISAQGVTVYGTPWDTKNAGAGGSAGQQRTAVPAGLQHGTGGRTCGLPRDESIGGALQCKPFCRRLAIQSRFLASRSRQSTACAGWHMLLPSQSRAVCWCSTP